MKAIRFSPKKLDAAADEFFDMCKFYDENPNLPVTTTFLEHHNLAGIALRKWAQEIREERRAQRKKSSTQ